MGGRGASSGSYKWKGEEHTYGDEYETLYEYRNIKFIMNLKFMILKGRSILLTE